MIEYWFMFPVGIVVATIAMAAGIGGAVLFSPLLFIFLKLRPDVAIGTGIFIEIFGFGSGFIGYAKKKLIDYRLGKELLILAIPAAIIGTVFSKIISGQILQIIFSIGIILLAFLFISKEKKILVKHKNFHELHLKIGKLNRCYKVDHNKESIYFLTALGGLFLGMLSAGLGEVNEYNFIKKLRLKGAVAAGTSVFTVMVTALVASISHFIYFFTNSGSEIISEVMSIVIFAAPGVIIGAQLGVYVAQKINSEFTKKCLFILFLLIGLMSIAKVIL
jgi:uncharacterized membrane protein YfcA|tara:strand:+ start:157 stop:984 length:828 start_codon:yes stop_codon:yes gene_type:complete